jgi:hypothetical protein
MKTVSPKNGYCCQQRVPPFKPSKYLRVSRTHYFPCHPCLFSTATPLGFSQDIGSFSVDCNRYLTPRWRRGSLISRAGPLCTKTTQMILTSRLVLGEKFSQVRCLVPSLESAFPMGRGKSLNLMSFYQFYDVLFSKRMNLDFHS